jgi:hypothetical protein
MLGPTRSRKGSKRIVVQIAVAYDFEESAPDECGDLIVQLRKRSFGEVICPNMLSTCPDEGNIVAACQRTEHFVEHLIRPGRRPGWAAQRMLVQAWIALTQSSLLAKAVSISVATLWPRSEPFIRI